MDEWKLLKDWYNSFPLTFPVQMKTLLSTKLCMFTCRHSNPLHRKEITFHGLYTLKIFYAKSLECISNNRFVLLYDIGILYIHIYLDTYTLLISVK